MFCLFGRIDHTSLTNALSLSLIRGVASVKRLGLLVSKYCRRQSGVVATILSRPIGSGDVNWALLVHSIALSPTYSHYVYSFKLLLFNCYMIRQDTRCYFNVRAKADISQLNQLHGTIFFKFYLISVLFWCLQCFDAVGWAAGRASGL